jgi:isopentenyldiphosphate isomerase
VDDFYGIKLAWGISFPITLVLLAYIYFAFNRVFTWHLIFTLIFVFDSLVALIANYLPSSFIDHEIISESVVLLSLVAMILFRKQFQRYVSRALSNLIPMTNNFEELYRFLWPFALVMLFYVSGYLIVLNLGQNLKPYFAILQTLYLGILFFLSVYEILRVQLIRSKLIREEWLPIVNNNGKIIGSIQHQTSLHDEKKYQHPVVRVLFVEKGMVLLNKKTDESNKSLDLWDSTISNHVVMEETIEKCVERTVKEKLDVENLKHMYLSTYTLECKNEIQYSFLFVSCLQTEFNLKDGIVENSKWWTKPQIEDNLKTGIFTENFLLEYDLLKRSGLLETEKCNCNCLLKDTIYNQMS